MVKRLPDEEVAALRALSPGDRVRYRCWRGGTGEGTFLRHGFRESPRKGAPVRANRPENWGTNVHDFLVVKRDFSADDGRVFFPLGDSDDQVVPQ